MGRHYAAKRVAKLRVRQRDHEETLRTHIPAGQWKAWRKPGSRKK